MKVLATALNRTTVGCDKLMICGRGAWLKVSWKG